MFESNTVFVVGAGASQEAGLPIGTELTQKIADLLVISAQYGQLERGDYEIYQALLNFSQQSEKWSGNQFLASGREVAEAMELALSIDTFLESHASNAEYVLLGKLGIVRAIAIEERNSVLAPSRDRTRPFAMKALTDRWYFSLARQLFTGIPVESPSDAFSNISFIVFNYDRCLQIFLIRALQVYFRLSENEALDIVRNVRILHPYGSLGSIFHGPEHVPFAPEQMDLVAAIERIRTFSESAESEVMATARDWVLQSDTIVFLGFGFHEQNMELLQPNEVFMLSNEGALPRFKAYATTYGLSDSDADVVKNQISFLRTGEPYSGVHPWIHTLDGDCSALFQSYWRSLTR